MRTAVQICLLVPLLSCGFAPGDSAAPAGVTVDTIGGVVHVTNSGPGQWDEDAAWRIDRTRVIAIGAADGPEPFVLGDVTGVTVDDDGRIYVADTQASEIRTFSAEGEFLGRFGRAGEGPGEFRNISGLGWASDREIAAMDGSLGRVSVFDADGRFQRSFNLERALMIHARGGPVRFDHEGRFYDVTIVSARIDGDTTAVFRYSPEGSVEDTIVTATDPLPMVMFTRDGMLMMSFPLPFGARPLTVVAPDGRIYATDGREYRISQLGLARDTVRVIRRTVTPSPVLRAERDSALTALAERGRELAGAAPRDVPALPSEHPAIVDLRVDEAGFLWVLRGGPSVRAGEWDVLDPLGHYLGSVTLPHGFSVMYIGERSVAGVARDELDVPTVVVFPLERS